MTFIHFQYRPLIQGISNEIAAQRGRLILWSPVFLAIGIGFYFSLTSEPPVFIGMGVLVLTGALWGLLWPLRQTNRSGFLLWLLAGGIFFIVLGFCTAQLRTEIVARPLLHKEINPVDVQGRIIMIDKLEDGKGVRLILDRLDLEKLSPEATPERIRLKLRENAAFHIGDRVSVLAGLKPPSAPVSPDAFDFQRYSYFQKIGAFGFAYRTPVVIEAGAPDSFLQKLENMREFIRIKIETALPYPVAAIATALMTGERTGISDSDWDALRASGLAHMLAISGLHVGLIASSIFMAVRLFLSLFPSIVLRYPIKKYAAFIALLGALGYTLIVGATIPTIRALIMTGIVLFAILIDRVAISLRLVAIAAFTVLLFLPESLIGASFQMSFAAVTALIFGFEQIRPYWSQWYRQAGLFRRLLLYFVGISITTVVATLATAPLSLFHFQQLAVYSLLSNLFAIPVMAFIVMPCAVLSYVLLLLGLQDIALYLMGKGIGVILSIAHGVTEMPLSTWTPSVMPLPVLLFFTGGMLFIILWEGKGRLLGILPILAAVLVAGLYQQPDILVSSSGKLVALRDPQGQLWVNSKRSERFTAEVWARRNGQLPEDLKKWNENPDILCDETGCRTFWNGRKFALVTHGSAQAEDCAWADVLVSTEPLRVKNCHAGIDIDRFDLWRNGAYAVKLDGTFRAVEVERGTRPWVISNQR